MIYVPSGTFTLGMEIEEALVACYERISEVVETDACRDFDFAASTPPQEVSVDPFWIDTFEVTFAQYKMCIDEQVCNDEILTFYQNHGISTDDDMPLTSLTAEQAQAFCEWRGAHLPSEIEWEFAGRGPEGLLYPWGNTFYGERANLCDTSCNRIYDRLPLPTWNDGFAMMAPVGSFPEDVSWAGIYDMLGNVAEWTSDAFHPYAPEKYPLEHLAQYLGNPVIRGGDYETPINLASITYRIGAPDGNYS